MATPQVPQRTFLSPSHFYHMITYTHLNPSGRHVLLYHYGGGDSSAIAALFAPFIATHPDLSVLCVDRWVRGAPTTTATFGSGPESVAGVVEGRDVVLDGPAREGKALLRDLSRITVELLDHLGVERVSLAGHSAGIYPLLDLLVILGERVAGVFPLCGCVPAEFTNSMFMTSLVRMPGGLFDFVARLDGSWILKMLVAGGEEVEDEGRVDGLAERRAVDTFEMTPSERELMTERGALDRRMAYGHVRGLGMEMLAEMYAELERTGAKVVWFTTQKDLFLGPDSVKRLLTGARITKEVDVVDVEGATHGDIFLQRVVWQRIHEEMASRGA